jgi:demethylmenaquinone methyltransferase/2-methoxy-6-polyprenyl-1,4-benzoquinol methylase
MPSLMTWQHGKPVKEYYDARAAEYDEWYSGAGLFAARERPGWHEAVRALEQAIASLPRARTLDVACGTGFLTRHLNGEITGLDQSERMLEIARARIPHARFVQGDAAELPFEDRSFDRVFTGHFYGHLEGGAREVFLAEARRLAPELIVVDSAVRPDHEREEWQTRVLNDGSRHQVYKRYFDPGELAAELGDGTVLHASDWFVMVASGDATAPSR